jgi:hypothetical protein
MQVIDASLPKADSSPRRKSFPSATTLKKSWSITHGSVESQILQVLQDSLKAPSNFFHREITTAQNSLTVWHQGSIIAAECLRTKNTNTGQLKSVYFKTPQRTWFLTTFFDP